MDWIDLTDTGGGASEGLGFMVGPYVTTRLSDRLYFDARLAYGISSNSVSPLGTYIDNFDGTRWMATASLMGDIDVDQFNIQPEMTLAWFKETSDSYVDGLANTIPAITVETGTLSFASTISTTVQLQNGALMMPFIGVTGIWTFAQKNTAQPLALNPTSLENEGLRASVDLGFDIQLNSGSSVSLSGYYDGIGDGSFEAYGVSFGFNSSW